MDIERLERWFRNRCDGDWEHQGGITIETFDNPAWNIKVDFFDLEHKFDESISSRNIERSDSDFIKFQYDPGKEVLVIFCGISNLQEAFEIFFSIDPEEVD